MRHREKHTKSASGSPTANPLTGLITQARWRTVCAITLAGAGLMAWYGPDTRSLLNTPLLFILYWGIFCALLAVSLFIVVLDIRYIHLQYTLHQRELFRETLGDETFRSALIAAQRKGEAPQDAPTGDGGK